MIQCRACECKQEPAISCKRCGKKFAVAQRPIEQLPVEIVQPKVVCRKQSAEPLPQLKTIAELEREAILGALEFYAPMDAAKAIGLGKTTLYRRMRDYGISVIDPERFKNGRQRKKSLDGQQRREIKR